MKNEPEDKWVIGVMSLVALVAFGVAAVIVWAIVRLVLHFTG